MILRFYAKGDALCPVPGQAIAHGARLNYVGRKRIELETKQTAYPATEEAYEVDSNSLAAAELKRMLLISSSMGDASLYCADKETSAACGIPFVSVAFDSGVWVEKAKASK